MEQTILAIVIQFTSCTFLLFAALLWMQRGDNRSRIYFSVACAVSGTDLFVRIFNVYSPEPVIFEALHPGYVYLALIEIPLFLFYIIEVVNPGWLNRRKIGLLLIPWFTWNIILLLPGLHFRDLNSLQDIFYYIGEFNVWLRLLFVLFILPYCIVIYYIPYNWRRSSVNRQLIRVYGAGFIIMALFFIASSISGSMVASSLHLLYGIGFCFYFSYYELFLRLNIPCEITAGNSGITGRRLPIIMQKPALDSTTATDSPDRAFESATGQLWVSLTRFTEEEKIWRNPDLTLANLAGMLNTNRTTLSRLFQEQGYNGGYKEFINRHRINDFLDIMQEHPGRSIQNAFFEAGYRSRMTAYRNFREYVGKTPSEYFSNPSE